MCFVLNLSRCEAGETFILPFLFVIMIDWGMRAQIHAQRRPELSSNHEVEYDGGSEFESESGDDNYTFESGHACHTSEFDTHEDRYTVVPPPDVLIAISSDESVSVVYAESDEALLSQDSTLVDLTIDHTI